MLCYCTDYRLPKTDTQYFTASTDRCFRRFRVRSRARPARQLVLRPSRPYLVVQIVHLRRSKYQQRRCHKERREVLCATNDSTLVYEYHVIHLSTTNREWPSLSECPFQNPEIANPPDADQKINFDPPVPGYGITQYYRLV